MCKSDLHAQMNIKLLESIEFKHGSLAHTGTALIVNFVLYAINNNINRATRAK